VNPEGRRLHLRGLHYALVGRVTRPDGKPYINDEDNWLWLSGHAAKAARVLGYLPWSALRDARNSPPSIWTPKMSAAEWRVKSNLIVFLPHEIKIEAEITETTHRQPWRLAVIAEKQGVEDVLEPIIRDREASLILPSGEISHTLVYEILAAASDDGRPLAIFQLSDADPAGNQMAVSTARTVQVLLDTEFPALAERGVRVHAIGLTTEQAAVWNLPSTPMKETEKRAAKWFKVFGWEQTELDAAVALVPGKFAAMVAAAMDAYWDDGLPYRDALRLAGMRAGARAAMGRMEDLIDTTDVDLGPIEVMTGGAPGLPEPLFDSADGYKLNTDRLKARKSFD
jgi:hypothetical protein